MQTPWGDLRIADSHVHFFSHGFFSQLAAQKGTGESVEELCQLAGVDAPPHDPAELAAMWVKDLDQHGVSSAALIASVTGDEDSVVAAVRAAPYRLSGWFFVNPLEASAPERVERYLAQGLKGICLLPAMHCYALADPRVAEVLSVAAWFGAAVFVHCGVLSVGIRGKLGLRSAFDMRYSNPIDLHPLALRHPDLNFVVPHFGAGYFREAMMLAALCPNVHFDSSGSHKWMGYQPCQMTLANVFHQVLEVAGPERILFGTDSSHFPRGWNQSSFEDQVRVLTEVGIQDENAALIFGGNLRRLMKIELAAAV